MRLLKTPYLRIYVTPKNPLNRPDKMKQMGSFMNSMKNKEGRHEKTRHLNYFLKQLEVLDRNEKQTQEDHRNSRCWLSPPSPGRTCTQWTQTCSRSRRLCLTMTVCCLLPPQLPYHAEHKVETSTPT